MEKMVSASILNADMLRLGDVIKQLDQAGADMLHFDVMDGVFVNNLSFGIPILKAISQATHLYLDVHLMITDPIRYVKDFAEAGADLITFHYESVSDPFATIEAIHAAGCKAGISIKPATPAEAVIPFLDKVDAVLVMTVEPGFGGQGYIPEMTEKIAAVRSAIDSWDHEIMLEVDGGINAETAPIASAAGAEIMVIGSYLFKSEDMAAVIEAVHNLSRSEAAD
ncbi:MAG: ribulose-phosphate 3-epimerase [Oscillospiraceae bacterium]|nr:ribulose-phosphate 3-epimerase [Oscillospiraceae bacterium]MBQ7013064.1 ribulose-phosphate 3-epimerase [Oscillospiraceae bacterium]